MESAETTKNTLESCAKLRRKSRRHHKTDRPRCYSALVGDDELMNMRLSEEMCEHTNNQVLMKCGIPAGDKREDYIINDGFLVKSENSPLYGRGLLTRSPLDLHPSSMCPDSTKHVSMIDSVPVSVACPTCWSVQRIQQLQKPSKNNKQKQQQQQKRLLNAACTSSNNSGM